VTRAAATGALGLALCLAAATFDIPSLYVPGIALAALGLGTAAWVWLASRGAGIVRATGPSTVVEEEPYPLRLEVHTGVLPPPGGALFEPLLGWPVPIGGRWSRRVRINVRFSRRGRRRLEPSRLVIHDPLRLAAREIEGPAGEELLVLPRVESVRAAGSGAGGRGLQGMGDRGAGARRLDRSAAELEIDGLRPYREGAPASRIHWPSVARSGEMLERRLVADLDSAPLVVLDAARPAGEEDLDRAVRAAGSLCLHLARLGGCAILLPGERRPVEVGQDLGAWPHVHARLAVVEAGQAVTPSARGPRAGSLFWVSGAAMRHVPPVLARLGAGERYLVSPAPLPGYRASFSVAGCTGQLLDRPRTRSGAAA
jgi:uncharacterized protein (DUF58 family)